jgi:DNA-binding HxlR family transcriptional regulator
MKARARDLRRLRQFDCPVYGFQKIINGKYKIRILWDLQHGPRRYGEIRHGLLTGVVGTKDIAPRVLSRELKELTALALIERRDYREVPPKVEYMLSAEGKSLIPVIAVMHEWGVQHLVKDSVLRKLGIQRD